VRKARRNKCIETVCSTSLNAPSMNAALRPRVTVIVTTRNNASALRYALESVIWQSFVNFEVWIIGDGCIDHSEDVVNSFCDPRLFWFNIPTGVDSEFRLIHEGMKRARGEYVAYLRDTDLWMPNHLEVLIECMEDSDADITFSITQCVYSNSISKLNIPLLPELPTIPDQSSVLHKKYCVLVQLRDHPDTADYMTEFIRRSFEENVRMDVVPVTTGLRFLSENICNTMTPQAHYMDRLRKDPDFVNKELSAILLRSEQDHKTLAGRARWFKGLAKSFQQLFYNVMRGAEKLKLVTNRKEYTTRPDMRLKQRTVQLATKMPR
jgi:glycosyltransferase involved in cell wall biosynthesis